MKCAVIGGSGALGKQLITKLLENGFKVISVDLSTNSQATESVVLKSPVSEPENLENASKAAKAHGPFDAVFCVAGGWQGGNAVSDAFIRSSISMWQMNVLSATLAASLCGSLHPTGLLVFTSAKASLSATSGMLGYGMAKSATNHLITSLASSGSGLPETCTVLGVLPVTLDTEANRSAMPKADFSTWTPLAVLAEKMCEWAKNKDNRPKSGSLVAVETDANGTTFK